MFDSQTKTQVSCVCASRHREEGPRKGAVVHKPFLGASDSRSVAGESWQVDWNLISSTFQWEFQDPTDGGTVPYKAIFCGDIYLHRPNK